LNKDDRVPEDEYLELRLLYLGHDMVEMAILMGALKSNGVPYVEKRDIGLGLQIATIFYSPATEARLYVARTDWVRAEELALTVLGENWEVPPDEAY
jgi:hypothetical protein